MTSYLLENKLDAGVQLPLVGDGQLLEALDQRVEVLRRQLVEDGSHLSLELHQGIRLLGRPVRLELVRLPGVLGLMKLDLLVDAEARDHDAVGLIGGRPLAGPVPAAPLGAHVAAAPGSTRQGRLDEPGHEVLAAADLLLVLHRLVLDDVHRGQVGRLHHGERVLLELDQEVAIVLLLALSVDWRPLVVFVAVLELGHRGRLGGRRARGGRAAAAPVLHPDLVARGQRQSRIVGADGRNARLARGRVGLVGDVVDLLLAVGLDLLGRGRGLGGLDRLGHRQGHAGDGLGLCRGCSWCDLGGLGLGSFGPFSGSEGFFSLACNHVENKC